jgi:hypothetical protein
VKIAALIALDAPPASYAWQVANALDEGASPEDILEVLTAVGPGACMVGKHCAEGQRQQADQEKRLETVESRQQAAAAAAPSAGISTDAASREGDRALQHRPLTGGRPNLHRAAQRG